jgi:hypothetical protein
VLVATGIIETSGGRIPAGRDYKGGQRKGHSRCSTRVVTLDIFWENCVQKTLSEHIQTSVRPDTHLRRLSADDWPLHLAVGSGGRHGGWPLQCQVGWRITCYPIDIRGEPRTSNASASAFDGCPTSGQPCAQPMKSPS